MHQCGLFHRDLSAANILLSEDTQEALFLCDFGLARAVNRQHEGETAEVITPQYRPPEIDLGCKDYGGVAWKTACDVWCIGLLFAEMMSAERLFPSKGKERTDKIIRVTHPLLKTSELSRYEVARCGYRDSFQFFSDAPLDPQHWFIDVHRNPIPVSGNCIDMLRKMLAFCPSKRATIPKLLQHDYFSNDDACKAIIDGAMEKLKPDNLQRNNPSDEQGVYLPFPPLPLFHVPELETHDNLQSLLQLLQAGSRGTELADVTLDFPMTRR